MIGLIPAFAQEDVTEETITPDNPLWGLDVALDNIWIDFSGSDGEKALKGIEVADERLNEAKLMLNKNTSEGNDFATRALEEHQKTLLGVELATERVSKSGSDVAIEKLTEISNRLEQHTKKIDALKNKKDNTNQITKPDLSDDEIEEISDTRENIIDGIDCNSGMNIGHPPCFNIADFWEQLEKNGCIDVTIVDGTKISKSGLTKTDNNLGMWAIADDPDDWLERCGFIDIITKDGSDCPICDAKNEVCPLSPCIPVTKIMLSVTFKTVQDAINAESNYDVSTRSDELTNIFVSQSELIELDSLDSVQVIHKPIRAMIFNPLSWFN